VGYSFGVYNKEQLYALVDAEVEIFIIYSLFKKMVEAKQPPSAWTEFD
jgi:hypothetical protein